MKRFFAESGLLAIAMAVALTCLGSAISRGRPVDPLSDPVASRLYGGAAACTSDYSNLPTDYCQSGCACSMPTNGTGTGGQEITWKRCNNSTNPKSIYPTYSGCLVTP